MHIGVSFPLLWYVVHGSAPSSSCNGCNPRFALREYERSYRSATNQMDLCRLGSVTFEWRFCDHTNGVTFLKLVFQINRYKVK